MTQVTTADRPDSLTQVTRRKVIQALDGVTWWGRLDEIEFLRRLYDLDQLPSTDSRFSDAEGDIHQHRVNNDDWSDAWIFDDDRFGLARGSDHVFLRFLAEMLHPEVRGPIESRRIVLKINRHLSRDGWEVTPVGEISGDPIYGMRGRDKVTMLTPDNFPLDLEEIVAAVAEVLKHRGNTRDLALLALSEFEVAQMSYDNLDGGITGWGLSCATEAGAYARLATTERTECENTIKDIAAEMFRSGSGHFLEKVVLAPRAKNKSAWRANATSVGEFSPLLDQLGRTSSSAAQLDLGAPIGIGGFGVVYKVRHELLQMDFAVKVFSPAFDDGSPAHRERFFREARLLFSLNHPHIVRVFDVGLLSQKPFIRMEYFDGKTLTAYLKDHGRLTPRKALVLIKKILQGLVHAHRDAKVIHRDLKPSNVMLAPTERVRVVDFGLGVFIEHELASRITKTGEAAIGGYYTAPELVANPKLVDPRSDLYSVAALWYTALTDRPPAGVNIENLLRSSVQLPSHYERALLKGLQDVDNRYASAESMLEALAKMRDYSPSSLTPDRPSRRVPPCPSPNRGAPPHPPGLALAQGVD
jgi:eukaryotic-like serine/threonine-protein kinase